jgi:hypothetical protein
MSSILIACAGFLAGILWMDLLFDSQIVRMPAEPAVAVISAYYENATLNAYPMNRIIGVVMLLTVIGAIVQLVRSQTGRGLTALAAGAASVAVGLALMRVVPNAMRMGARSGELAEQVDLARSIFFDHIVCLILMVAFIVLQVVATAQANRRP